MSATVKLVWLNPVIIACPSQKTVGGPAAVHFQRVPRDVASAIGRQQEGDPLRDLLLRPEPMHRRAPLDRGQVEAAGGGQRARRLVDDVARRDRIDADAALGPL